MQLPELLMKPAPFKVRFANMESEVEGVPGETLLDCARRAGVRVATACGGSGVCASCIVSLVSGRLDSCSGGERSGSVRLATGEPIRACQVRPAGDCVVEVSPRALASAVRAEVAGRFVPAMKPAPTVRKIDLTVPSPGPGNSGGDLERLFAALEGEKVKVLRIDLEALKGLPLQLREEGGRLRAVVRDDELIGVLPAGARLLGLAVDLGTTNAAASLIDLESGVLLSAGGIENPQAAFGADLISRINHAVRADDGSLELHAAAVDAITTLAARLCETAQASPVEIVDIAVCGNTAMHHLLLELPVAQLGRAPFVPAALAALDLKARDLGIAALPGAYLHAMPNIGGFVGGDHVATLLATEEFWSSGTTLVIDIGTNTELSLIHGGEITTASTASGPSLEGGNISSGMRAAAGAIEKVWLEEGGIRHRTIGDLPPVGICGSGVIDAVAALRGAGIIDRRGYMRPAAPVVQGHGELCRFPFTRDVSFTQDDVRAVQLAKGAIRAGIDLLLRHSGLAEDALDRVVVAGGFGAFIDIGSAVAIGLFPPLPLERFQQVGNAAGVGVRMALASGEARAKAKELALRCRHLELNRLPEFQKVFLDKIKL